MLAHACVWLGCQQETYVKQMGSCSNGRTRLGVHTFDEEAVRVRLFEDMFLQWFQSRWHRPQDVSYIGVHINHLLGILPSTLNPLSKASKHLQVPTLCLA